MQVTKRLQIYSIASVTMGLIIVLMLFLVLYRVNLAMEELYIAGEIVSGAFERSTLREDYLRTGNERAKVQWFAKHEQIGRLLKYASKEFNDTEDKKTINEMIKDHESTGKLFSTVVENREKARTGANSAVLSQEIVNKLINQLGMSVYEKVLNARKLHDAADRHLLSTLRMAGGGILCIVVVATIAAMFNSWKICQILTNRIGRLRDGALVIGGGNLEYRIDIKGDDEFAELSEAFDAMTAKLQGTYLELEKSRNAAEAANKTKSQFLANMSHELRTPLNGILGVIQLLLTGHAGPLEGKQKDLLLKANKSTDSLLQIISDILDLSRIEAGKLRFAEKPFSLRKCVSDAVDYFSAEAQQKGLDLTHSIAEDVPDWVRGDQVRLRQVLVNLIGNGVKFTEQGKVGVQVSAGSKMADGKIATIFVVTDTGIGVPPDKKNLLFHPFSQVDTSDTRRYGGTGLGLVISRQIVEMMGGSITYENREGGGSCFSFTVFLEEAANGSAADNGTTEIPPSTTAMGPTREPKVIPHILAAEDDALAGELLKQIIELYGLEMDLARTGQEAVEMWEKGSYDLIIMDVQMPRMDGITATRHIRHKEKTTGGHIPIIAMTAHAYREDEERCFAAGMDGYLTKPLDLVKGREVIMSFLKK